MQKNYFNWLHLINDLKPLIEKTQIKSIFTQRKDEIILHLLNPTMDSELGLRISIDSQLPFMITEKTISRKSNSVGLFQDLYEKKIERLHIVQGQRLVVLYFDDSELWISPFGSKANIVHRQGQKENYFKLRRKIEPWGIDPYDYRTELSNNSNKITENMSLSEIKTYCKVLNPAVFEQALFLHDKNTKISFSEHLSKLLDDLEQKPVYICYYDPHTYDYQLSLIPLDKPKYEKYEFYPNSVDAFQSVLFHFRHKNKLLKKRTSRLTQMNKELDLLMKSRKKMRSVDIDDDKKEKYRLYGDLIKANLYQMREGMEEIEVNNIFSDKLEKITIPLKKNLSPEKNAGNYYQKINAFSENRKVLAHRLSLINGKIAALEKQVHLLEDEKDFRRLNRLISKREKEIKMEQKSGGDDLQGIRKYVTPDNWQILVGKDNKANDRLTFKIGKNKDIWMHAHGVSGSHVVILNRDKGSKVPKEIIKLAAGFTAFFSKAKNAGTVPVIYTEVRYVRKPRGAKPGTVTCQHEKTVFVKPTPMP